MLVRVLEAIVLRECEVFPDSNPGRLKQRDEDAHRMSVLKMDISQGTKGGFEMVYNLVSLPL